MFVFEEYYKKYAVALDTSDGADLRVVLVVFAVFIVLAVLVGFIG